jgi:hypothetical protein
MANVAGKTGRKLWIEASNGVFMIRLFGRTLIHILDSRVQQPLFGARNRISHWKLGPFYIGKYNKLNR